MSNYVRAIDLTAKDALPTGNPNKIIKGSEMDDELDLIASHSATKADKILSAVNNNVIKQDGSGNLVDAGYSFSALSGAVTCTTAELNKLDGATVTTAEINYLSGVTSAIQTQLDGKLVKTSNLSDLSNAATARTNLGLGSIALLNSIATANIDNNAITKAKIADATTGSYAPLDAQANTERVQGTQLNWQKVKEIYVPIDGSYTVDFDFKQDTSNANACYARIHVDGVATGTQRTKALDSTYTTYSETITVTEGQLIQLYYYTTNLIAKATVRNFKVKQAAPLQFVQMLD